MTVISVVDVAIAMDVGVDVGVGVGVAAAVVAETGDVLYTSVNVSSVVVGVPGAAVVVPHGVGNCRCSQNNSGTVFIALQKSTPTAQHLERFS